MLMEIEITIEIEIEIEIGKGEGERETETERQREKEKEEWGSRRHCCRSLIFFDPISVFFSASHSRSIARPLTTGHTGAPTPPFSGKTSPLTPFCSGHTGEGVSLCSGSCHCSSASLTRLTASDLEREGGSSSSGKE